MKLLCGFLLVITLLGQFVVSASCQQITPTLNPASNTITPVGPTLPVANSVNSSPTITTLSPTGARRGSSISTITACDFTDSSGSFPSVDDVCSMGGQ